MIDRLRRSVAETRLTPMRAIAIGAGAAATAILARLALASLLTSHVPATTLFPALLAATLWGGRLGGAVCLLAYLAGGWAILRPLDPEGSATLADFGTTVVVILSGGLVIGMGWVMRGAVLELARARDQERFLARELRHRVKNILSVVQALVQQSSRVSDDHADFLRAFRRRLSALEEAQSLLADDGSEGLALEALVLRSLRPFAGEDTGRIAVRGGPAALAPENGLLFALCLHELATNAAKYGALSEPSGRVEVEWTMDAGPEARTVIFRWREEGGPAVALPKREGFGSRLLRRGGAEARLEFLPQGVRWTTRFPAGDPAG